VSLSRARAEDLRPEPRDVVGRGTGRDHLDRAAGEAVPERPGTARARPVDEVADAGEDHVVLIGQDALSRRKLLTAEASLRRLGTPLDDVLFEVDRNSRALGGTFLLHGHRGQV